MNREINEFFSLVLFIFYIIYTEKISSILIIGIIYLIKTIYNRKIWDLGRSLLLPCLYLLPTFIPFILIGDNELVLLIAIRMLVSLIIIAYMRSNLSTLTLITIPSILKLPSFITDIIYIAYRYISIMKKHYSDLDTNLKLRGIGGYNKIKVFALSFISIINKGLDTVEANKTSLILRGYRNDFYLNKSNYKINPVYLIPSLILLTSLEVLL